MSDEYTLCPNCRDRYAAPGSAKCHACREQDMLDAEPWLDEPDFKGYGIPDVRLEGVDQCPHCRSWYTERIDTICDDPVIWIVQCETCGETFEELIPPHDEPHIIPSGDEPFLPGEDGYEEGFSTHSPDDKP